MAYTHASEDFTGNVTVVTGGANGIGAEVAQLLRRSGATVVVRDLPRAVAALDAGMACGVDVNLVGVFNVCRAVVPHMRSAGAVFDLSGGRATC